MHIVFDGLHRPLMSSSKGLMTIVQFPTLCQRFTFCPFAAENMVEIEPLSTGEGPKKRALTHQPPPPQKKRGNTSSPEKKYRQKGENKRKEKKTA